MKAILRTRIFWLGLALKVALLFSVGSSYLTELFIPFLDQWVRNPAVNPWSQLPTAHFPYGSALFVILAIPRALAHLIFGEVALGTGPIGLLTVKAPVLLADLGLMLLLARAAGHRWRRILSYYWLNPIVFYICYIHVQLDVFAMAFCLASLLLALDRRIVASGLVFAAALLCKFHVALLVPWFLVYFWWRDFREPALRAILRWSACVVIPAAIGFIPHFLAGKFGSVSAFAPESGRVFGAVLELGGGVQLYLGLILVLGVVARLCLSSRITNWGWLLGPGIIFGSLLLATAPMPGWFLWVLPFLALAYSLNVAVARAPFFALNLVYLGHFWILPTLEMDPASGVTSGSLSLLQACLAGTLVSFWFAFLKDEVALDRGGRSFMIGLAGDSGAGKNRLSETFRDLFDSDSVVTIEGDDYHKWERGSSRWRDYTHLHPRANHLGSLANHARLIQRGISIRHPQYDHSTGTFSDLRELRPKRIVIVQGLHTLYLRRMRENFDLRIFLDPADLVRLDWKLQRDSRERGHSVEKVLASLDSRQEDSERHIRPQRAFADWIIEFHPQTPVTREQVIAGQSPRVYLKYVLWNDAPVGPLFDALASHATVSVSVGDAGDDLSRLQIEVRGEISAEEVEVIALKVFPQMRQLTRNRRSPHWLSGFDGIHQLTIVALLTEADVARGHA